MKIALVSMALLAATAMAQSPAPAPAGGGGGDSGDPDEDEGETACKCRDSSVEEGKPGCYNVAGAPDKTSDDGKEKWVKCAWYQECYESSNISFSFCKNKENIVCEKFSELGTDGYMVGAAEHHPSKTCCDGAGCSSLQTCVEQVNGGGTDGIIGPATFSYNGEEIKIDAAARNGWKDKKGEAFKNKPKVCTNKVFDTTPGSKAVFTPMMAMAIVALGTVQAFRKKQVGMLDMILPLIVIVTSFFLTISAGWAFALFTMVVAAASIATPAKHQGRLVLFQLAYVWLYFGGTNFFFDDKSLVNFFTYAQSMDLPTLETSCTQFYSFYGLTTSDPTRPWDMDGTRTSEAICGREWIGYLVILAYAQAFALILMVTLNTLAYLSPADGDDDDKANSTTNPAVEMP